MKNNEKRYFWQTCQDEELNKNFCELHQTLVEQIIEFCIDRALQESNRFFATCRKTGNG